MDSRDYTYMLEKEKIKGAVDSKLRHCFGKSLEDANKTQIYKACSMTIRDDIMEKWTASNKKVGEQDTKKLCYLSIEFLMGRAMGNNLMNTKKDMLYKDALSGMGIDINELEDIEPDAGLGNGGLGRLAACFLDSITTSRYPAYGFSIRYEYGLFKQKIIDGYQVEVPDPWLKDGNVWEVCRPEEQEEVRFGGSVTPYFENGRLKFIHKDYYSVAAIPYDVPIIGYDSPLVNTLRLWSARSSKDIDMGWFSQGNYIKATEEKELSEVISKVLYPDDNHYEGKLLRLKQHYFFTSATIQYIVKAHKKDHDIKSLPEKVTIHINDTHPALAIPELMRILLDEEELDWDTAWSITKRTFAYTNHTVMAEALETWPISMFKELLPRIYMIIEEINERYCKYLWNYFPGNWDAISEMAIISYGQVKMANLCIVGSFSVNGVSKLHTEILKNHVFKDFYTIEPQKFCSITNGMTHRRWLLYANPRLSNLITESIGEKWILNSMELKKLESYKNDPGFIDQFKNIRMENKQKLAKYILDNNNVLVDPSSIFDVQIKRLHEYKRQLLNVIHIMYLYNMLLQNPSKDIIPRTFIFGSKASPGYNRAKLIIKLINTLADKVNNDKSIKDKIKIVFIEDYRVSIAEKIIPASDVSEQISTAGKEASGTGNMKLMLNGALTIGTLDGANVEMREAVGPDNIYIFGLKTWEVQKYNQYSGEFAREIYEQNFAVKQVLDQLINGFLDSNTKLFQDIYNSLLFGNNGSNDQYMVLRDFEDYANTHERLERDFRQPSLWYEKSIINVANSGFFSSDRSIEDYNKKIWNLKKVNF